MTHCVQRPGQREFKQFYVWNPPLESHVAFGERVLPCAPQKNANTHTRAAEALSVIAIRSIILPYLFIQCNLKYEQLLESSPICSWFWSTNTLGVSSATSTLRTGIVQDGQDFIHKIWLEVISSNVVVTSILQKLLRHSKEPLTSLLGIPLSVLWNPFRFIRHWTRLSKYCRSYHPAEPLGSDEAQNKQGAI